MPEPAETRLKTAQIAYDHLKSKRTDDEASVGLYFAKAERLMTSQVILFAAVSFALTRVGWATGEPGIQFWGLAVSGSIGVLSLAVGFLAGIQCIKIRDASTVNVELLQSLLKADSETGERRLFQMSPEELHADLAFNLANEINKNRRDRNKPRRRCWARVLNCATVVGFLCVAVFVAWAVVGGMIQPTGHFSKGLVHMNGDQDSQAAQGDGPDQGASPSQGDQAPEAPPSAVEPSATEQKSLAPDVPSAVEGMTWVQAGEDPPEGGLGFGPLIEIPTDE